jgi:hypothetical protein
VGWRRWRCQLSRNRGLSGERITAITNTLAQAERQSGAARRTTLERLAGQVDGDAAGAGDAARVRAAAAHLEGLVSRYGEGRWLKRKGTATVRLSDGSVCLAELHWYEAHGLGRKLVKLKRFL